MAERANAAIDRVSRRPRASRQQRQAGVKLISEMMTAAGLTSVHDASTDRDSFIAYQDALAADEMRFRVYVMVDHDLYLNLRQAGLRSGFGDDRLRIGGVKLFCDGSASERTMRMSKPYVGRPNDFGILTLTQDKLNDLVTDIHGNGFQVGVHANGDVAIDMVLRAYELALRCTNARASATASSIARWSMRTCSSGSPRSAPFRRRSTPTSTTTATNGPSTARNACAGCSPTNRFSIIISAWPGLRTTCRGRSSRSWPSRAW